MCSLYVGRDVSCQHIALVVFIACHLCITSHQGGSSGIIFADGETEAQGVVWTEGTRGLEACWNPELHWRCFLASLPDWLQEQIRDASHGWLEVSRGAAQLKMGSVVFVCLFSELLSRWYGFKIAAAFKVKTSCCCSCSKKLVPWSDTTGADSQLATAAALPGPSFFSPQHHAEKASNMVGAWSAFPKGYAKYLFFSPGVFSELIVLKSLGGRVWHGVHLLPNVFCNRDGSLFPSCRLPTRKDNLWSKSSCPSWLSAGYWLEYVWMVNCALSAKNRGINNTSVHCKCLQIPVPLQFSVTKILIRLTFYPGGEQLLPLQ